MAIFDYKTRDFLRFLTESHPSLMNGPLSFKNGACKTQSLRGWGLYGSKLKGIFTSENQGNALRQDFALLIGCKNRALIKYSPQWPSKRKRKIAAF